ncbi:MAG: ABC transporter ATP-binding protein [Chloroflexi bacterium]|nr:ABC transporter ATP-binding protein [Chloroflexota bacterium]
MKQTSQEIGSDKTTNDTGPLLQVQDLAVHFVAPQVIVKAVDGVSFSIRSRETFGLVGESGSGKTVTCRSILRLIHPPGEIVAGSIRYQNRELQNRELLTMPGSDFDRIRGREISMIFQDPMTALNPVLRIGNQILETLSKDDKASRQERTERAIQLMKMVGIPAPERRLREFPHQFSGGMRQRVMIAIALSRGPHLLLADEPTTAIDVTIQDQILKLLMRLQRELGMSMLFVTHDLGIVAQTCDTVAVMYAGRIVEQAATMTLFKAPHHPYTLGLIASVPSARSAGERLQPIPGSPPNLAHVPEGCRFHPRCAYASDECRQGEFPLREISPEHLSACIKDVR